MFKQSFIPGFPEGAQRIGEALSILKQDARVIYFVGGENYVDHKEGDKAGERFAFACLMENGHVRATDLQKPPLSLPQRTLMNWCAQYRKDGSTSFFRGRPLKKPPVMTEAMRAQCAGLLDQAINPSESDLQPQPMPRSPSPSSTKSARSQADAQAASGIGTACTRADERIEAAFGLATSASARFESVCDVPMAGLLAGLPALCANGLFSGLDKHLSLPKGFYSALHILLTTGSTTRSGGPSLSSPRPSPMAWARPCSKSIVPQLLGSVPQQPTPKELDRDPLLHRFVIVFDRECSNYKLIFQLWQQCIGAIT